MSIMNHGTDRVKPSPCPCEDCQADKEAARLAAQLGMVPTCPACGSTTRPYGSLAVQARIGLKMYCSTCGWLGDPVSAPAEPAADAGQYDVSMVKLDAFEAPAAQDDDLDLAAEHADRITWNLFSVDLPRTYFDRDNPADPEPYEPPGGDREWLSQFNDEGCGPDDLTPEEEEILLWGESEWVAACKEHAREMETREMEHAYHEMIGRLMTGGHPASEW